MSKDAKPAIRVGIGGWTFEPWRCDFYPEGLSQKRELEYASRQLTSIEVNGTFYGSQKPDTFAKWHDETSADFVFALKGPRFTTNRRVLAEAGESISRFIGSAASAAWVVIRGPSGASTEAPTTRATAARLVARRRFMVLSAIDDAVHASAGHFTARRRWNEVASGWRRGETGAPSTAKDRRCRLQPH